MTNLPRAIFLMLVAGAIGRLVDFIKRWFATVLIIGLVLFWMYAVSQVDLPTFGK